MNKNELIVQIAQQIAENKTKETKKVTRKDVAMVVDTALDIITNTLAKQENVSLIGFGAFTASARKEREGTKSSL